MSGDYYGQNNQKIPFRYKFPLYAEYSSLEIDIDKIASINEQSTRESKYECIREISNEFIPQK